MKNYKNGEIIITDGDENGDEMFFILIGDVGVYKNYQAPDEIKITDLKTGSFFGEMTLFLKKARTATVVAQGDVTLMAINRDNAYYFFATESEMTYNIIRVLCQRLEDTNAQLAAFQTEEVIGIPTPAAPENPADTPAKPSPAAKTGPATVPAGLADLFPEGHGSYEHAPPWTQPDLIYPKKFDCPLCEQTFTAIAVRTTRLKMIDRDKDFRNRFDGIDTVYHEVITCPHCCFSGFEPNFKDLISSRLEHNRDKIAKYKAHLTFGGDAKRDITGVFGGYYLALKCAELFYAKNEIQTARILIRIMWLYDDCGDAQMTEQYRKIAQEAYITAFKQAELKADASQQICVIIGELSLMLNDIDNAKTFFLNARNNRNGSTTLISQAEDGIDAIRNLSAK